MKDNKTNVIDDDRPKIEFGDRFFPCSSCTERKSCKTVGACHKWKYYLGQTTIASEEFSAAEALVGAS